MRITFWHFLIFVLVRMRSAECAIKGKISLNSFKLSEFSTSNRSIWRLSFCLLIHNNVVVVADIQYSKLNSWCFWSLSCSCLKKPDKEEWYLTQHFAPRVSPSSLAAVKWKSESRRKCRETEAKKNRYWISFSEDIDGDEGWQQQQHKIPKRFSDI